MPVGTLHVRILEWVALASSSGSSENLLQHNKNKCTTTIILKGEKLKALPLRSETRQRYPLSPLLFNTVLEALAMAIKEKEQKESFLIYLGSQFKCYLGVFPGRFCLNEISTFSSLPANPHTKFNSLSLGVRKKWANHFINLGFIFPVHKQVICFFF